MLKLAYKSNAAETVQRLTALVERRAQDRIFALFRTPSEAMRRFIQTHQTAFSLEYPDPGERVRFWDELLAERSALEDDSIPYAYPSEFDQGLYGGLLGGDVRFLCMAEEGWNSSGWISSMIPPLLRDWSEFDALRFDEHHPWWVRYVSQLEVMSEAARGKFGVGHFTAIDSLNFVYELVGGTNTYLSLYEAPDMVRKAIDFAFDLNVKIHRTFFDIVPDLDGGTCGFVLPWIPGRVLCESVDPFHMTSVADFERWGFEPIERIFREFDGGVLHLHGNGGHLLEAVCRLPGLKVLRLSKDWPGVIETLGELRRRGGDTPLTVDVDYPEFVEALSRHTLPGGVFYNVSGEMDVSASNRCMEMVRSYRV